MSIQRPSCFFNLCSSCSSRSNKRPRDCLLPLPTAGCAAAQVSPPHRTPIAGLAIPLLTHTCCYSPAMADEPVNPRTPPCGKQLPSIPWLRVVPFLGLAVVQRPGALGTAWSTWSMNDIHRKWTVRGEGDSWVHGHILVFCDLPSKSLCQACWAANLSRRGELHSAGRENGLSVMRNGL